MKQLGILVLLALFAMSTSAVAVDITYGSGAGTGAKDESGAWLEGIINPDPLIWDGEYLDPNTGNPLVLLFKVVGGQDPGACQEDDELLDATTIGAGKFLTPFNGEWSKVASIPVLLGDQIYVRLFNNCDECPECGGVHSTHWTQTAPVEIHTVQGGTPADYVYNFPNLQTLNPCIPEPSILIGGLALLLLRRKR
jgi:hypothetical protein